MNTNYNYYEAMKRDIREYIAENCDDIAARLEDRDSIEEELYDEMFTADSVTGNGSGSYTCDRERAKNCVVADGFQYIGDAIRDFCISSQEVGDHFTWEDWEWFDVTIRCSILWRVLDDVLDEIESESASIA